MTKKMSAFPAETAIANIVNLIGQIAGPANVLITPANAFLNLLAKGGALVGVQQLTANGTYTPTTGAKTALVLACGAGGGAGAISGGAADVNVLRCGSPGGAGELRAYVLAIAVASYAATIGSGGSGGVAITPTNGSAGGATKLNDGSTDLLICSGGSGGTTNTGNQATPTGGANGTGGTGGIALLSLMAAVSSANNPSLSGATAGNAPFNYLFGAPSRSNSVLDVVAGVVAPSAVRAGAGTLGRGSGGLPAFHYNGSTSTSDGGPGSSGYMLIIEFG